MNAIETVLSQTADVFEQRVGADQQAQAELIQLCGAGGRPHVERVLSAHPGLILRIEVHEAKY
jgi:hypothetical protein